jgi:hypothetical protein
VCRAYHEGRLAEPGAAGDHGRARPFGGLVLRLHHSGDPRQFRRPAGEVPDGSGQFAQPRSSRHIRRPRTPGLGQRDELLPTYALQLERIGDQRDRTPLWSQGSPAFHVAERPDADTGGFSQLLQRQPNHMARRTQRRRERTLVDHLLIIAAELPHHRVGR